MQRTDTALPQLPAEAANSDRTEHRVRRDGARGERDWQGRIQRRDFQRADACNRRTEVNPRTAGVRGDDLPQHDDAISRCRFLPQGNHRTRDEVQTRRKREMHAAGSRCDRLRFGRGRADDPGRDSAVFEERLDRIAEIGGRIERSKDPRELFERGHPSGRAQRTALCEPDEGRDVGA
jgi:hypothetical protein